MSTEKETTKKDKQLAKDTSFPLDSSGVAIVTFIDEDTVDHELKLMNVSAWARGEQMPEAAEEKVRKYNFSNLSLLNAEQMPAIAEEIHIAMNELREEKLIALVLQNVPNASLSNFLTGPVEIGGVVQWHPEDLTKLLRAVRMACGVQVILQN